MIKRAVDPALTFREQIKEMLRGWRPVECDWSTMTNQAITVYGAYGHTGRFVVSDLVRRGLTPILSGRDALKLNEMANAFPGADIRIASISDASSLDRALDGAAAIINCAGPFLDSAPPLIAAALRAGIHYLDVTAEQRAALDAFENLPEGIRESTSP